jgi:hypothetical protein
LELVIHNSPADVSVEHGPSGKIKVHVSVHTQTEDLVAALEGLAEEVRGLALALWSDPSANRKYVASGDQIIVTSH